MRLPKVTEVTLRPVMSSAFHTVHMLDAITMKSERLSLTKLDSVEFAYLREGLDQYYASLELVRSFSRILSVELISDDLIGSQADEIQLTPAPLPCHSNLNGPTFLNSSIDPISISEFLFATQSLEQLSYRPDLRSPGLQDFDAFWIRTALMSNARSILKSLSILAHNHARDYMGSVEDFLCWEFLKTDLRLLIGAPAESYHDPLSVLPASIIEVKLHVDHSLDASRYKAIMLSTKEGLKYCPHLSDFTVVGIPHGALSAPSRNVLITEFRSTALTFSYHRESWRRQSQTPKGPWETINLGR